MKRFIPGLVLVLSSVGCASGSDAPLGTSTAALRRARDCNELLAMLKDDAQAKMNARIDAQILLARENSTYYGGPVRSTGSSTSGDVGPPTPRAAEWSDTNVQVAGVDEGDIVESDGENVYVLHGQSLVIARAWPAATAEILTTTTIEGEPSEMMVSGERAVIFSNVDGRPIYTASGTTPRAGYEDGLVIAPDVASPTFAWYASPLTKVTVLALARGAAPTVVREQYFEGTYVSARRTGTITRGILRGGAHGPALSYWPASPPPQDSSGASTWIGALEDLRAANARAIEASSVADWLPLAFTRDGASVTAAHTACEDYYVPSTGSTASGLTQIVSFDATSTGPAVVTSVLGATDTVYASAGALVLASRAWGDPVVRFDLAAGVRTATAAAPVTLDWTYLHQLDSSESALALTYVASGKVPGTIVDQFSLDERNGRLRVATTEQRWTSGDTQAAIRGRLFVLGAHGSELRIDGDAGEIAPGEQVYSTRFVGDRGYVVTYRRVDPLFVFDLSDPLHPTKRGELELPGFSTYMQPIDDGHLLTIGQDGDETGRVLGLALRIFDVTDAAAPKLAHTYSFRDADYGWSEASHDHHAFTFFPARGLLTFPFVASSMDRMRSTAEVFRVSTTDGFTRLGAVDHSTLFASAPAGFCGGYFSPQVRRGVFLEDVLVSISYGGIVAASVADLSKPLRVLPLPAPAITGAPVCDPIASR